MDNLIDFSLIITCHNLETWIRPCLASLQSLLIQNLQVEFIFILDDCVDKTEELINEYMQQQNILYYIYHCNYHSCGLSRNEGLIYAKGKYIWFIDGDDWIINNNILQDTKKLFKQYSNISVIKLAYSCNYPQLNDVLETPIWRYIYTKDSIKDLQFIAEIGEDRVFMENYNKLYSKKIYYKIPSYFYNFNRPGSIMYEVIHNLDK